MLITAFTYLDILLDSYLTYTGLAISGVTVKAILWTPLLTPIRLTYTYVPYSYIYHL